MCLKLKFIRITSFLNELKVREEFPNESEFRIKTFCKQSIELIVCKHVFSTLFGGNGNKFQRIY